MLELDTEGCMPANPSVEQIEGETWPEPASDATYVIRRVHQLRRVPVGELSIEDLRIMLSQSVGTVAILPRVLYLLEENPLSAGDFYPGDLLVATLRLRRDHWSDHVGLLYRAQHLAQRVDAMTNQPNGVQTPELRRMVREFLSN
ncbi:contact-dependent growth inhibition system immunity protein [Nocardia sp. NPDC058658]|uniref:contact-dependent growth inhibition system immunity protein n=1 Tax=Nocardia sp. NPDC058658 TaxID=3346580 RepID=UPI00364E2D25